MVRYIFALFILLHIHQKVNGQNIFPAPVGNKWGFINTVGEWVHKPVYSRVELLDNISSYRAYNTDEKKTCLILSDGKVIHKSSYLKNFKVKSRGDILVIDGINFTDLIIDTNGNAIGITTYEEAILPQYTNLIVVKRGRYYGVINCKGETVLKTRYVSISDFSDKGKFIAVAKTGRKSILFDSSGNALKTVNKDLRYIKVVKGGFFVSSEHGIIITDKGEVIKTKDELVVESESAEYFCQSDSIFSVLAFEPPEKGKRVFYIIPTEGVFKEISVTTNGVMKVRPLSADFDSAVRQIDHKCFCGNIMNPSDSAGKIYYRLLIQDSLGLVFSTTEAKTHKSELVKYNKRWGIVNFEADTLIEQFKYTDLDYWDKGVVLIKNDSGFRFFNFITSELSPFYIGTYNELYRNGDFYLLPLGGYYTIIDLNTFHLNDFNKKLKGVLTPLPQSDIFKPGFKIFRDAVALVVNGKVVYYNNTGDKIWEQTE